MYFQRFKVQGLFFAKLTICSIFSNLTKHNFKLWDCLIIFYTLTGKKS